MLNLIETSDSWGSQRRLVIMLLPEMKLGNEEFDLAGLIAQAQNLSIHPLVGFGINLTFWRGVGRGQSTEMTIPFGEHANRPILDFYIMGREFFNDSLYKTSPFQSAFFQCGIRVLYRKNGEMMEPAGSVALTSKELFGKTLVAHEGDGFNNLRIYEDDGYTDKPLAIQLDAWQHRR